MATHPRAAAYSIASVVAPSSSSNMRHSCGRPPVELNRARTNCRARDSVALGIAWRRILRPEQILDFVLKHALLVIEQVAQGIVDRQHRDRHVPHRGTMLVGQPIENLADVAFCLGAVFFKLG